MATYSHPDGLDALTVALALAQCSRTATVEFTLRNANAKVRPAVLCFDHFLNYVAGGTYNVNLDDAPQRERLVNWLIGSPVERIYLIGQHPTRECDACKAARCHHGNAS